MKTNRIYFHKSNSGNVVSNLRTDGGDIIMNQRGEFIRRGGRGFVPCSSSEAIYLYFAESLTGIFLRRLKNMRFGKYEN